MLRLFLLVFFAALPLFAAAHEGHHRAPSAVPVEANGAIVAVVSAPSRCPGGDELCCCHDLTCAGSYQPAALAGTQVGEVASRPIRAAVPWCVQPAPRAVALARHSPRGPPAFS